MSLACYEDRAATAPVIGIVAVSTLALSVYWVHLFRNRRSTKGFHFIRTVMLANLYIRLMGFSTFHGGGGTLPLYKFVTACVVFSAITSMWQWARHVIMALYQSAFGETTSVRAWKVIIPTIQVLLPLVSVILMAADDATVNRGLTKGDIALNAIIISNLVVLFGIVFAIHADAYRKVRNMPKPDATILKKIRYMMLFSLLVAIAMTTLFTGELASRIAAGSKTGYQIDEQALAEEKCNIPSIVVLESMASVFITVLMYHTDVKVSGGAASSTGGGSHKRLRSSVRNSVSTRASISSVSSQNGLQRKVSVSVQPDKPRADVETLTPSMVKGEKP